MSKRLNVLSIITSKKNKEIQSIVTKIRSDCIQVIREKLSDPMKQYSLIQKLLKKNECKLFLTITNGFFSFGRSFNDEILDLLKFKIINSKSTFKNVVSAELNMKYYIFIQNIADDRICNLIIDVFNMKSSKVCLKNIKYCWIFSCIDSKYIFKYCRILSNDEIEDIGPYFELELVDKYYCSDELYKKSFGEISKKNKKINKNEFKDEIGTLHIDKQDLREIKTRKYRK